MAPTRREKALRRVEDALADLRRVLEAEETNGKTDSRWLRLLTMVEDRGGRVSAQEFVELGRAAGYDNPRGLGGFFHGDSSMRVDGDDRVLTETGKRYLDRYGRRR